MLCESSGVKSMEDVFFAGKGERQRKDKRDEPENEQREKGSVRASVDGERQMPLKTY